MAWKFRLNLYYLGIIDLCGKCFSASLTSIERWIFLQTLMLLNIICFECVFKIDLKLKLFWIVFSLRRKENTFIVDNVIWGFSLLSYWSLTAKWEVYVALLTNPSKWQRTMSSCGDRNDRVGLYLTALSYKQQSSSATLVCFCFHFILHLMPKLSIASCGEALCMFINHC